MIDRRAGPGGAPAAEPATLPGVLAALAALPPGRGVATATALLAGLAAAVATGFPDPLRRGAGEFAATVTVELTRRYLRAVRGHAAGGPVAGMWRPALDGVQGDSRVGQLAAGALLEHDLPIAVVSACTLLGRPPGPVQRRWTAALAGWIGVAAAASAPSCWVQVERLWAVRGRPVTAAAALAALDRRAGAGCPRPPAEWFR